MITLRKYLKQSVTYKILNGLLYAAVDFLDTTGKIVQLGLHVLKCICKGEIGWKELLSQCDRFGVSSLPITT